jgi:hypothetical protein
MNQQMGKVQKKRGKGQRIEKVDNKNDGHCTDD